MKNRFIKFILSLIIIMCILIIAFCGLIVFDHFNNTEYAINIGNSVVDFGHKVIEGDIIGDIQETLSKIEGAESQYSSVDYSNITVDKYFYNQLEDEAKTIYKSFESNKENMKTGTYKIELGTIFTDILTKENGQEQLGKYYQSAIESYTYDNPDIFYLDPKKMYLNIETITKGKKVTYNVFIDSGTDENYLSNDFSNKEQIDEAIKNIENVRKAIIANKKDNIYDNIKMVHDYLVQSIDYDSTLAKSNIYNIYGALVNKECVCEGYAKSFKYLMDGFNIPCTLVIGKGRNTNGDIENHAWNYVQIDNKWYAVDCTWDDPVLLGFKGFDISRNSKYFLLGENVINQDHMPSGKFTDNGKEFKYPILSKENYK